jgi:hypothetical protein
MPLQPSKRCLQQSSKTEYIDALPAKDAPRGESNTRVTFPIRRTALIDAIPL